MSKLQKETLRYIRVLSTVLILVTAAFCATSCKEEQGIALNMASINGEWTRLTRNGSEWVVFNPCDAQNQGMIINYSDSTQDLIHMEGHEASMYNILAAKKASDGIELVLRPSWSDRDSALLYIRSVDQNTIEVSWSSVDEESYRFCRANSIESYKVIDQPCKECWDEADCDPVVGSQEQTLYQIQLYDPNTEVHKDSSVSKYFIQDHQYLIGGYNYPKFEVRFETDTSLMLILGPHTIEFVKTRFRAEHHNLTFTDSNSNGLIGIDGNEFYGTDLGVPKYRFESIMYEEEDRINFPDSQFSDLYNPNLLPSHVSAYETDQGEVIITMLNSDGAGSYFVTWILDDDEIYRCVELAI